MPRLSVWFVRCALLYLALGFTLGALMLFEKGVPLYPPLLRLLPAHIEFVLFGWTVQLAMGIAFWILPRFSDGTRQTGAAPARGQRPQAAGTRGSERTGAAPSRGQLPQAAGTRGSEQSGDAPSRGPRPQAVGTRGNEIAAWLAFGLLNAGVWLAGLGPMLDAPPTLPLLGRASEALAAVAFLIHAWPRIKAMRR